MAWLPIRQLSMRDQMTQKLTVIGHRQQWAKPIAHGNL